MDCLSCGNCKDNQSTYFCLAKNDIVCVIAKESEVKKRSGWKKGSTDYEKHRRNIKKEVEV